MASQIIELPTDLFATFRQWHAQIAIRLGDETEFICHVETPAGGSPTLVVQGFPDTHGLGHRTLTFEDMLTLAFVPRNGTPAGWPRPLPDAVTLRLIDLVEPVLSGLEFLTAHQRIALADAFARAREAPGIGPRPVQPLPPRRARQRRLRRVGLELTARFGSRLEALDRKLESYQASLLASDLEAAIMSLSGWTEIGTKLYLRPRPCGIEPMAALVAESRRGDLRAAMECANVLADTTIGMLEAHDPHAAPFVPGITVRDLMLIHGYIGDAPLRPLRTRSVPAEACGGRCVPPAGIRQALNHWSQDMWAGLWTGIHPLVHAALGYRELLRIRPFAAPVGRPARLILQLLLHRSSWPVLPWEAVFELLASEQSGRRDCCQVSLTAFMDAILTRAELAIGLGGRMLDALTPVRDDLVGRLSAKARAEGLAGRYAADLLRGPLVLGLSGGSRDSRRQELRALAVAGRLDHVWSPFGMVYSVPEVRRLMRDLPRMIPALQDASIMP